MMMQDRRTCSGLLLVHIDHALLLVLVAVGPLLLALPVECWPCIAAILCTPAMLDIHHAFLQATGQPAEKAVRL